MITTAPLAHGATNSKYYLNPQGGPSPPLDASAYQKTGFATPMAQTPPSNEVSPTTRFTQANNRVHYRQLRPQRQPLGIPAALRPPESRPADIPRRPRAPDTPPGSKDNSFDSAKSSVTESAMVVTSPLEQSEADQVAVLRRGLSRAASEDLNEELGEVTGEPTTAHWKPDSSSDSCPHCQQIFTWYFRRHHCRRCGDVVCDNHSRRRVPLDQNARYHPQGVWSRACDHCVHEWKIIKKLRHYRTNSIGAESFMSSGGSSQTLPIPGQTKNNDEHPIGSMARSEGMTWSTF